MLAEIHARLQQVVELYHLPGLAVGIVVGDALVYAHGFGVRCMDCCAPVTPGTLFHLASISKTFIATAVLQLAERGRLDLSGRLVEVLPNFRMADLRYQEITIRQMLSHTSGMPDIEVYGHEDNGEDENALSKFVHSLADESLVYAAGEGFAYSNMAYDVLGEVIARCAGQSFESAIDGMLLAPLGMQASTFLRQKVAEDQHALPHLNAPFPERSPVYPYQRAHAPSGSMHSSVLELSRWAIANLNHGQLGAVRVLEPSSHALMWEPVARVDEGSEGEMVCLSWFRSSYRGEQLFSHSGGDTGFTTNLALLPERGWGVIVLANTFPAPADKITRLILDGLLGLEPEPVKLPVLNVLIQPLQAEGVEAGIEAYRRLQSIQPEGYDFSPDPFMDTAYILADLGQFVKAEMILQLGLALFPESDAMYFQMAWACWRNGRDEAARRFLRRCLELNPQNQDAGFHLRGLIGGL